MWYSFSQSVTTNYSKQFSAKFATELVPEELTAKFSMWFDRFQLSCNVSCPAFFVLCTRRGGYGRLVPILKSFVVIPFGVLALREHTAS
jgi:hypothetical protein